MTDILADNLNESNIAHAMLKLFEQYNDISSAYDDLSTRYDEICSQANNEIETNKAKEFISALSTDKCIPIDFSNKDTDELLDKIRMWLDSKYDMASDRAERKLPNYIKHGKNISILGAKDKSFTLSFDKLHNIPEAVSEEQINVTLQSNKETFAKGCVKLTFGYINFDEDGGASDGIKDSIDYKVNDVLNALNNIISDLKDESLKEHELVNFLEECLKLKNEYRDYGKVV